MADKKFEEGPAQLDIGMVLGDEWQIIKKLGEGGCGAVYLVESNINKRKAALKAESNFVEGGSVLKLEVAILGKLKGKKYVAELLGSGRRSNFQYVVMSLLGQSLCNVLRGCGKTVSVSTHLRVGIHMLHGLKQIHDAGFIHRDIKPANLALGNRDGDTDPNFIYILDFGLSREFVTKDDGKLVIRKPRRHALFRGTTRYCSVGAHERQDQGRVDDMWSLVYVMVELRGKLPWNNLTEKKELAEAKRLAEKRDLFGECPSQIRDLAIMLRKMDYWARPDYYEIYRMFLRAMNEGGYKFSDLWDWQMKEHKAKVAAAASGTPSKASKKSKTSTKCPESEKKVESEMELPPENPFTDDDFDKNPLGL